MKQGLFEISSNREIARNTYEMRLAGDASAITAPGQFVNIKLAGHYLRRPISVCDWEKNALTIIYKVVGKGTSAMARMGAGETLDLLTGLGNGFDISKCPDRPLIVGGGAGIPPLYLLAKRLVAAGARPVAVLGFNSNDERFYEHAFEALGIEVRVTVCDGAPGCVAGYVTDAMREDAPYVFACGPEPMLRAVYDKAKDGQFSFESRMGCGFGACLGCSCRTRYGNKRICTDGPVLERGEIIW